MATVREGSSRLHAIRAAFDGVGAEPLRTLLHRPPRAFGHPTRLWMLDLTVTTAYAEGITAMRVSGETGHAALARLGIGWRRAKTWITSADPA